tara:strand:- start:11415 stop:11981 length:567 start_codon:yes stop_codon:yes gene_type:complete
MTQAISSYIPKGANKVTPKTGGVVFYTYTNSVDELCAMCFVGRAQKPTWRYRFSTEDHRERCIKDQIETVIAHNEAKEGRRVSAKQPHTLKVDDVLYSSWGYDQTNINFYQVTKLVGKTMVELRAIAQTTEETGMMSGHTKCHPGQFKANPIRRKVNMTYGSPSVAICSFEFASLADVDKEYSCSWCH